MKFWKKIFRLKKKNAKTSTREEIFHEEKLQSIENVLGKSHNIVGHAIIPFDAGGTVDMYYFPNGIEGTGVATMELISETSTSPIPNRFGTFELVAFTKEKYTDWTNELNEFSKFNLKFNSIFTRIGDYSFSARLDPGQTCELPMDDGENLYFIFDNYSPENKEFRIGNQNYCLLLLIQIFDEEWEYAKKESGSALIEKLKLEKVYPYSDMNRQSVLK